jgi:hypothetical protein
MCLVRALTRTPAHFADPDGRGQASQRCPASLFRAPSGGRADLRGAPAGRSRHPVPVAKRFGARPITPGRAEKRSPDVTYSSISS